MQGQALEKVARKVEGSLKQTQVKDSWPEFESLQVHVDSLADEVQKHRGEWLTSSDVFAVYYDLVVEAILAKAGHKEKITAKLWDWLGDELSASFHKYGDVC